jgi:hypothetical protein
MRDRSEIVAMPKKQDFEKELNRQLGVAQAQGKSHIDINSGELHRDVGGYPGRDHRMPICCDVMTNEMKGTDRILNQPKKGRGAGLTIRYLLPR